MMKMNMTMTMDDDMSMSMTFSSWSTYQIQILFSSWDISTRWQYVLSWLAVALAAVFYHAMRYWVQGIEADLKILLIAEAGMAKPLMSSIDTSSSKLISEQNIAKIFQLRIFHAFMNCLTYGVSAVTLSLSPLSFSHRLLLLFPQLGLMLMLIAMTFNPGIFLALVVGYFFGDLFFHHKMTMSMFQNQDERTNSTNERL
jgi:hypothetical protein